MPTKQEQSSSEQKQGATHTQELGQRQWYRTNLFEQKSDERLLWRLLLYICLSLLSLSCLAILIYYSISHIQFPFLLSSVAIGLGVALGIFVTYIYRRIRFSIARRRIVRQMDVDAVQPLEQIIDRQSAIQAEYLSIIRQIRANRAVSDTKHLAEHNPSYRPSAPSYSSPLFVSSTDNPSAIQNTSSIRIRILEEPLTAQNLTTIITALDSLYTKCWLIANGRFADLSTYSLTHSARFAEEANLVITDITHNSPFNFDISLNPESVARAMQVAIDSVSLAGFRKQEAELANKAQELEIMLKEREAQAVQDDKDQARQIEAQKAELERQRNLLEIEKQQLEIEKQRFNLQAHRISFALKTAGEMVDLMHPGLEAATKGMIVQSLVSDLLQLANGKGLELGLPAPKVEGS